MRTFPTAVVIIYKTHTVIDEILIQLKNPKWLCENAKTNELD